jgi:hypothetical protein
MQRQGASLSGLHLKGKAKDFWSHLSIYRDQPVALFLNGWLEHFKHRCNIRSFSRHGEAG